MALPLPRVVPDAQAGGGILAASNALNDYRINQAKADYASLTTEADAASKLAYANLMGPQFLAKLFGNSDVLANLNEDQLKQGLNQLYKAGTGANTGASLFGTNRTNGINSVVDKISEFAKYGWMGKPNNLNVVPQRANPILSNSINNIPQGNGRLMQDDNSVPALLPLSQDNPQISFDKNGRASFAENVGKYEGTKAQGKESGKLRAQEIDKLSDIVYSGEIKQATLDDVTNILGSKEFEQIRQLPLAGRHELAYYSKFGTPAQQQLVGKYFALTGNIIKDASRDFAGQFRKGEQQLLAGMKPTDADTVDAARGKVESLSYMNKLLTDRARLTSQLMSKYQLNKVDAMDIADKQINGEKIRNDIHDKLNPTVKIKNKKTGEEMTVPISEAREKYGVSPNV